MLTLKAGFKEHCAQRLQTHIFLKVGIARIFWSEVLAKRDFLGCEKNRDFWFRVFHQLKLTITLVQFTTCVVLWDIFLPENLPLWPKHPDINIDVHVWKYPNSQKKL